MTSWSLRITADGSHTVFSEPYQSTYHSMHGAWQESMHVFIHAGLVFALDQYKHSHVRIWEMGFGTGLNAFLSWHVLNTKGISLDYHALDIHPLPPSITAALNYPERMDHPDANEVFEAIHQAPWDNTTSITPGFNLTKQRTDITSYHPDFQADVIYYDAFGPGSQSPLWTEEVIRQVLSPLSHPGTVLTTYSSQGSFRRALSSNNFLVTKIPGPPGKREMIRAIYSRTDQ